MYVDRTCLNVDQARPKGSTSETTTCASLLTFPKARPGERLVRATVLRTFPAISADAPLLVVYGTVSPPGIRHRR